MQEFTTQAWPGDQQANTQQCSGKAFKKCHYLTQVVRPYFFLRPKDSPMHAP